MSAVQCVWLVGLMTFASLGVSAAAVQADDEAELIKTIRDRGGKVVVAEKVKDRPVIAVYLNNKAFGDADLAPLKQFKLLRTLNLQIARVTDAGLKDLAGMDALESLDLFQTGVTPAGLKHLTSLKSLNTLGLNARQLTDESLRQLRKLGLLHKLNGAYKGRRRPISLDDVTGIQLHGSSLTLAGYKELAAFKNLTSIDLVPGEVTDGVLRTLKEMGKLHALYLASASNGQRPTSAAEVAFLRMNSPHVTEVGMREFAGFTSLRTLDVNRSNLTDAALKEIAALTSLQTLHLNNRVTDAGLKELAALTSLRELTFDDGSPVTDAGLKDLGRVKSLQVLSIHGTKVTPAGLKGLAGLKLHSLFLGNEQVTDTTLQVLREINLLHALGQAHGYGKRAASLDTVFFLRIDGTQVSDVGLRELTGMTSLKSISLRGTRVTDKGVAELQKALPKVKIVR